MYHKRSFHDVILSPNQRRPISRTSGTSGTNNVANSPANAESDSSDSAGFKATASVTVIGGALAAAAFALF
ncbi:hypothetical protein FRC14_003595 [Serendipita sp. 396]|nr:hypothetical protein FRC14_003595 [Serendipita sp. 396]